jgi:hypothetical protein
VNRQTEPSIPSVLRQELCSLQFYGYAAAVKLNLSAWSKRLQDCFMNHFECLWMRLSTLFASTSHPGLDSLDNSAKDVQMMELTTFLQKPRTHPSNNVTQKSARSGPHWTNLNRLRCDVRYRNSHRPILELY